MIIVDASVWAASLLNEDVHHAESLAWIAQQAGNGEELISPFLVLAEVGGAVARRLNIVSLAHRMIEELAANPALRLFVIDERLARQAAHFAIDLRLRGADSVYVALASELGAPLASWDREQRERAAPVITTLTPT